MTAKWTIADDASNPPLNLTERSTAPSSPSSNDIYLDDGTNTDSGNPSLRRYTGAGWEDVGGTSAPATTETLTNKTIDGDDNTIRLKTSTADVSNPPTDAELDSTFGTPATVGAGFTVVLDDNGADTNTYLVVSNGTSWIVFTGTKAT